MTPDPIELRDELIALGGELGLLSVTVAGSGSPPRHAEFVNWLDAGYAGTMSYLGRQAERRGNSNLVLPRTRSIVSVSQSYFTEHLPQHVKADPSRGQIASYAWGADYHDVLLEKVQMLAARIIARYPAAQVRCYVDTGPISERDVAEAGGAGFIGKNTLLIKPRAGSLFFLGEILTTVAIAATPQLSGPSCGSCTRCLDTCPTHAFPTAFVLNSNLCISYLTIEYRGVIALELRRKMGNHIFGCDDCQTCCPWNERFAEVTNESRYHAELARKAPRLSELAAMSADDYREFFAGSAVLRCTYRMMLRNVAIALGNWGTEEAEEILLRLIAHTEPLVRAHAVWGLNQCESQRARHALTLQRARESDPLVLAEFAAMA